MIGLEDHFLGKFWKYQSYDKNQLRRKRVTTAIDRKYVKLMEYTEGYKQQHHSSNRTNRHLNRTTKKEVVVISKKRSESTKNN